MKQALKEVSRISKATSQMLLNYCLKVRCDGFWRFLHGESPAFLDRRAIHVRTVRGFGIGKGLGEGREGGQRGGGGWKRVAEGESKSWAVNSKMGKEGIWLSFSIISALSALSYPLSTLSLPDVHPFDVADVTPQAIIAWNE